MDYSWINNGTALSDFVEFWDLRDNHSNIDFRAITSIQTAKKTFEGTLRVRVTFSGYDNCGTLVLDDDTDEIDYEWFPFEFKAQYQTFELVQNNRLRISGTHKARPEIGEYSLIIRPLT